jgi:hypothetical protein
MTKKAYLIISLAIAVIVALVIWYLRLDVSSDGKRDLVATTGEVIKVNDYEQNPALVLPEGQGLFLAQTDQYIISLTQPDEQFTISILAEPIGVVRTAAELKFIELLGIDKQSACKLKVFVGGPVSVDERFGNNQNIGLSFCPGSVSL